MLTKNKSSIKDVINAIIEKHYGLSRNLLTKENKNFVYKIISSSLKKIDTYKFYHLMNIMNFGNMSKDNQNL